MLLSTFKSTLWYPWSTKEGSTPPILVAETVLKSEAIFVCGRMKVSTFGLIISNWILLDALTDEPPVDFVSVKYNGLSVVSDLTVSI